MSLLFADLSNNNPSFDAREYAKAGHLLIGLKATEGSTYVDKYHRRMTADAHEHDVAVAHYHFAQPNQGTPEAQARHFWRIVEPHFQHGDYVVLDLEVEHRHGAAVARAWARAFNRELRRVSGHRAVLYSGRSFLDDYLTHRIRFGKGRFQRFWVAEYGPRLNGIPWARPVWAWQRTDGKVGRRPYHLAGCPSPGHDVNVLGFRVGRHLRRVLHRA